MYSLVMSIIFIDTPESFYHLLNNMCMKKNKLKNVMYLWFITVLTLSGLSEVPNVVDLFYIQIFCLIGVDFYFSNSSIRFSAMNYLQLIIVIEHLGNV